MKTLCDTCILANNNCPVYPLSTHGCKKYHPDIAKIRIIVKQNMYQEQSDLMLGEKEK